ncbi:hypothetical protein KGP17_17560 [Serratia sp. JSRIV001]|uniref:hypothetical protein n=1 Tax=Serratia sp. JSRIV001 TaxID=2831893 RepID=UPI001CBAAF86|nr:hypothetical protein [Serratia sp. JSRIV001]UAN44260.1 hypothetical protein KGP17_17560 [Serratia sp. JSRIV001]
MIYKVVFDDGHVEQMALSIDEVALKLKEEGVQAVTGLNDERQIEEIARKLLD